MLWIGYFRGKFSIRNLKVLYKQHNKSKTTIINIIHKQLFNVLILKQNKAYCNPLYVTSITHHYTFLCSVMKNKFNFYLMLSQNHIKTLIISTRIGSLRTRL